MLLSKIIGPIQNLTMSATTQTFYVYTSEFGNSAGLANVPLPATKVRIATNTQPAYVNFGAAATTGSIFIPANYVEHFKLPLVTITNTVTSVVSIATATVSVLQAGTGGIISVAAVA